MVDERDEQPGTPGAPDAWGASPSGAPAPPPPPPGYDAPQSGYGQPGDWGAPAQPQKSHKVRNILIGLAAALVVFGVIGALAGGGKPLKKPDSIAGATLAAEDDTVRNMAREIAKDDKDAVVALYERNGAPAFYLIADNGRTDIDEIEKGFRKTAGAQAGPSEKVRSVRCIGVSGADGTVYACFWGGKRSGGMVVDLESPTADAAAGNTEAARAAVEA